MLGRTPFTNGAGNFGQRLGGANRGGPVQLSTFADLHRPQEAPYTARGAQRRRPGPPRAAPAAPNFQVRTRVKEESRPVEPKVPLLSQFPQTEFDDPVVEQQHQQTHGGINIQNVPGFKQHQLHLQRHQQQIQAQLALAGGKGVAQHHRQVRPQPRPASAARRRPRPHPALARRPQQVIAHPPPRPTPRPTRPRVAPAIHVAQPVEHHQNHHIVAAPAVQHVAAPVQPVAHHHEHHEHHVIAPAPAPVQPAGPPVVALEPIPVRQGLVPENNLIDLGEVAVAGEKCIDKLVVVEETETDEQVECHHSYDQKCHTTYTTDFEPQSEEKCEETFKKNCFIEYSKTALNETVEVCHTPLVKDCNVPGPVECITEYESECETTYHTHTVEEDVPECVTLKEVKCETKDRGYTTEEDCTEWPVERCNVRTELVNKVTPETACRKVPKEKCAPQGCGFVQGVPECFDKVETVIQEVRLKQGVA